MFHRLSRELPTDWDRRPWYRELSLKGWAVLLFAIFTSFSFLLGLLGGVTLFLPFARSKSGPLEISFFSTPVWFAVAMAVNFTVAAWLWYEFVAWLRSRRQ
jgi:hypothetical protein